MRRATAKGNAAASPRKVQKRVAAITVVVVTILLIVLWHELIAGVGAPHDSEHETVAKKGSAENALQKVNGPQVVDVKGNVIDEAKAAEKADDSTDDETNKLKSKKGKSKRISGAVPFGNLGWGKRGKRSFSSALQNASDRLAARKRAVLKGDIAPAFGKVVNNGPMDPWDQVNDKMKATAEAEYAARKDSESKKYFLARPLQGQVSSDEHFKPEEDYSSWWCGGPPGGKDVFGQRLDPRSYCVFRNVCIKDRRPIMFPKKREDVPNLNSNDASYRGLPHCVFRDVGEFAVKVGDEGKTLREARAKGKFLGGLTAIVSSSYGQEHITHFMEPLGQLFYTLNIFGFYSDHGNDGGYLKTPLGPNLDEAPPLMNNSYAFERAPFALKHAELERVLVVGAGGVAANSFPEMFYRMLYTNHRNPKTDKFVEADYRPRIIDDLSTHDGMCFDEMVMAGASYDPFHKTHTPSYYRQRNWFYRIDSMPEEEREQIRNKLPGLVKPSATALKAASEAAKSIGIDTMKGDSRPVRNILMAHRSSKRKITNKDELDRWMAEDLPVRLPQFRWAVRSVYFGQLSNTERVHLSQWADVLIGIHGADLTNLVNMKPGSVVIELNMLYFFESRFKEMAGTLQQHYFAWTCTRPTCTNVWHSVVKGSDFTFDPTTERLRLNPAVGQRLRGDQLERYRVHAERTRLSGGWFKWPTDRYVGYDCIGCDLMTCCTSLQGTLYGTQRESDINFGPVEFEEMFVLMNKTAHAVGTPYIHADRKPYAELMAAAKAANEALGEYTQDGGLLPPPEPIETEQGGKRRKSSGRAPMIPNLLPLA